MFGFSVDVLAVIHLSMNACQI